MIGSIDGAAAVLLDWLVRVSWQSSLLVLLLVVADRLFARFLSAKMRCALFGLVVIRLCLPALPRLSFGLLPLEPPAREAASIAPRGDPPPPPPAPLRFEEAPRSERAPGAGGSTPRSARTAPSASLFATPPKPEPPPFPFASLAAAAWLAIAAGLFSRHAAAAGRLRRGLARAPRLVDPEAESLLEECRRAIGLRRPVELVFTDLVPGLAITGVFRHRLLVPPAIRRGFRTDELRPMILHELAHARGGDLLWNWLFSALQCLHWFNPFVRLALARLRASREIVRDADALAADPRTDPSTYAASLLELLENAHRGGQVPLLPAIGIVSSQNDIVRRILMLTQNRRRPRGSATVGAALLVAIGAVALTSGIAPGSTPEPRVEGLVALAVTRSEPEPEWRKSLKEKLDRPVRVAVENASLPETVAAIRAAAGGDVDIVVAPELLVEDTSGGFSIHAESARLEDVLRLVCRIAGCESALVNGAVALGRLNGLPLAFDLRFYDVRAILRSGGEFEERSEELVALVRDLTGRGAAWESEWSSIECWNHLLFVRQTEDVHREVESLLGRLLNGGRAPELPVPAWRERIEKALATELKVSFVDESLDRVTKFLGEASGVPIRVARSGEEESITLDLGQARLSEILSWIEQWTGYIVESDASGISLVTSPSVRLAYFDVADLLRAATNEDDREERRERLSELIRYFVSPRSWEREGTRIAFWDDLLVVAQSEDVAQRLDRWLGALRRALHP